MRFNVTSNSIPNGIYFIQGTIFFNDECVLFFNSFKECKLISELHLNEQTTQGRLAGGLLGLAVAGPLGAIAGLFVGGKKNIDEIDFFCELDDGRSFVAKCSTPDWSEFQTTFYANRKSAITEDLNAEVASKKPIASSKKIKNETTKNCPACDESIKINARICRYCSFKFDLVPDEISSKGIIDFKNHFNLPEYKYEEGDLNDADLRITYYICRAIEARFSQLNPNYSVANMVDFFASRWSMHNEDEDYESPDEFYERLANTSALGDILNEMLIGNSVEYDAATTASIDKLALDAIAEFRVKNT